MNIWEQLIENYNLVDVKDCNDGEKYFTIALNKKHGIGEFQDAILKAHDNHEEEIYNYGNDWEFIEKDLENFDYFTLSEGDYWVEY